MLPYSIREGLAGFQRAKFAVLASTSAMAVALVLIGLFGMLSYEAQQVSTWLRQRVGELEIFLEESVEEAHAQALYRRAGALPGASPGPASNWRGRWFGGRRSPGPGVEPGDCRR